MNRHGQRTPCFAGASGPRRPAAIVRAVGRPGEPRTELLLDVHLAPDLAGGAEVLQPSARVRADQLPAAGRAVVVPQRGRDVIRFPRVADDAVFVENLSLVQADRAPVAAEPAELLALRREFPVAEQVIEIAGVGLEVRPRFVRAAASGRALDPGEFEGAAIVNGLANRRADRLSLTARPFARLRGTDCGRRTRDIESVHGATGLPGRCRRTDDSVRSQRCG